MLIRFAGLIALILVALSLLDYFGTIQIISVPLKMFAEALIRLGNAVKEGASAL